MSIQDAAVAMKEFLRALEEAHDMAAAGAIGSVLDDVLCYAGELLDVIDESLEDVDRQRHASLFAAALSLRQRLDRLPAEIRAKRMIH